MNFATFFSENASDASYVIAEIGNNHQGSVSLAADMIKAAHMAGANCVKFQRRTNRELYTESFYNSPYENPNSFASTYGEHRDFLELSLDELVKLKDLSDSLGIDFLVTPFDFSSLEDLIAIGVKSYKIASADIVHTPLIERVLKTGAPLIISTGHCLINDIDRVADLLNHHSNKSALLHCTASYPSPIESMNLNCIPMLIDRYGSRSLIGLSDHENGIDCASTAYMLGARVFEKHFTLDRSSKGTDNAFSLEPQGLEKLVRNLKRIPLSLGNSNKVILECEKRPVYKMRKSLVYKKDFSAGHLLSLSDIEFRCPGDGLEPYKLSEVIGRTLLIDVKAQDYAHSSHLV